MDPNDAAALVLDGVGKAFRLGKRRIPALSGVSLQARTGLITGLIGPDGAGKTTLMRLAAGLLLPDEGRIVALDRDVVREPLSVQAMVGYMPQRFGLYDDLSVWENLTLYSDLQGVPPSERPARYEELMHMTGLEPFTERLAGRLSGGMKQKLGLACTLVSRPRLLLLDEPTVGVDPVSRRELWQIIDRLVQQTGMAVLLSTAYLDEAERCHEVVLLHEGQVLDSGPPAQFSAGLEGRTFVIGVTGPSKRAAQETLRRAPGIADAVLQGDGVRVVTAAARRPDAAQLLPDVPGVTVAPVVPRFEDAFVTTLQAAGPGRELRPAPAATTPGLPADQDVVIRVRHLSRRFGDFFAVADIGFDVQRGEVFGLLGANGAGKTTTFRMLCGLLPPSAGELSVAGRDLRHAAAAARARIGYMSQKFSLYGNLTVAENLAFFSRTYGLRGARQTERLQWALEELELAPLRMTPSAHLPLGYQQRLALACALMHQPDILFLDEPTSGVDPLARREFWARINALAGSGVTIMVTTHFMEEAEYCDRLAIMAAGRLLVLDTPRAIKTGARSSQCPQPTMEDAFISLIESDSAVRRAS